MTVSELEHFRDLLLNREENLNTLLDTASLQEEESEKVQSLIQEIKGAFDRMEKESYGGCSICDGEVEKELLEIQPATQICLECISQEERTKLEEDLYQASEKIIHQASYLCNLII